jgi:hypothetical protein
VPCSPASVDALDPAVDALLLDCDSRNAIPRAGGLRRRLPALPIVTCSIRSSSEVVRGLGAVAHLTKPFTRTELDRALVKALDEQLA